LQQKPFGGGELVRKKPENVKPYLKLAFNFKSHLKMSLRSGKQVYRLWYPSAWVDWLLWDVRTANVTSSGYKDINVTGVEGYKMSNKKSASVYKEGEVPKDWLLESLLALEYGEWITTNAKKGSDLRIKPLNKMNKYFFKLDDLEKVYDPYAINGENSNATLLRRIEAVERNIRAIGELVGMPNLEV
jgi:hypothetical protein